MANLLFQQNQNKQNWGQNHHFRRKHFDTFVPGVTALMLGLGITISLVAKWQSELALRQRLEKEKATAELAALKAQINPHFFFNTLNTIYAYTLTDGDVARKAISDLSKMMRHILYDSEEHFTLLGQEIAFIQEYINLMKLRITDRTLIVFLAPEQTGELQIAPMLLLPFIENAFKHGVSNANDGVIKIMISVQDNQLKLHVQNVMHQFKQDASCTEGGIGIDNTVRRLNLLYPDRYELAAGPIGNNKYDVRLKIAL